MDGIPLSSGQIVPKWSEINISVVVDNPTDLNFDNLYLDLSINNQPGFARKSLNSLAHSSLRLNLTWHASIEGPLSLGVSTMVIDYSSNSTEDTTISLSKFIEIETTSNVSKDSGSWFALFAVFVVLSVCSYILYSGVEEDLYSSDTEKESDSSNENIEGAEVLREMALPQENKEEKED